MALLETFLIPFGTSILANFGTDSIKAIFTNNSIDKYEKSFINAMVSTIKESTAYYLFEDKIMQTLVQKIEDDEEILLVAIEGYCKEKDKNFFNLIETDNYKEFFIILLKAYDIYPSNKDMSDELYIINLSEFLVNYKYKFFKLTFSNHEIFAVFNEVLKIDNIMDLLKDMNLKIDEFDNIKNLFLEQYTKVNQVYKKNRDHYDKYINSKFEFLELAGFSPKISGKDIFMKLSDVFIPLSINGSNNNASNTTQSKQRSIENILQEKALVILGDPGSGKSTLLKYIASYISANREKDWHYKETIPILIKVSEYADWYQTYKKGLFDYIVEHDSQYADLIKENIEYSNLLILLDGLDEITDSAIRNQVVKNIIDVKSRYPLNRYIVTSRLIGYRETSLGGHFVESKLLDFSEEDIQSFAKNWYRSIAMNIVNSKEDISDDEKDQEYSKYNILAVELFDSISRNQSVIKFAKNPLLMTIVAMIFYQSKKLPNKRVELYDIATETFLDNWVRVRFQENSTFKDKGTILELLPHIAFHIHKNNSKGLISEDDFKKEFINIYEDINGNSNNSSEAKKEFKSFKEFLEHYTGFFYRKDIEGSLYGFVHLTFEEYLSALELKSKWDLDDLSIEEYIFDPRWIEVIRLSVANIKISNKGKSGRVKATQFINQILDVEDAFPEAFRTLQMTLLILADDIEVDSTAKEKILKNFIKAISEAKYFSLKKSFAKLYSELLFSIYKDELLVLTVNEISKNNMQFIENITQVLSLINNKDVELLFTDLVFNEKERRKISFSSIENIYILTFNKNVNNFLRSKKFLNKYRKYIIENSLEYYNSISVYMSFNGFNILGNKDDSEIKKLYKFFNNEDNTILQKKLYYFLASSGSSNTKIFIHNIDIIQNTYFREKLLKVYSLYEENENREAGHTSTHHNYTFLLKKQNDTKLIYDFEEAKVYEIKKTTQIKHSQFRGCSSSKKDELKLNIKYLQGDNCCSKKVDYFIYVYEEKDKLFNFFDWENFLLKNFSENYEKLSLILLENIVAYERYKDSEKITYIKDIIKSEYFQDLIAPVQLFFLKQSNIEYDKSLIDNSLNYFREIKNEKLKNGIYHILYDILTPY